MFGSTPSCAAVIIAARKDCGEHSASFGVDDSAESTMRVNRSGVITLGSAFLIAGSIALIYACIVFFSAFAALIWPPCFWIRFFSMFTYPP